MKVIICLLALLSFIACAHHPQKISTNKIDKNIQRTPTSVGKLYLRDCYQNSLHARYYHWADKNTLYNCRLYQNINDSEWYQGDITYADLSLLAAKYNAKHETKESPITQVPETVATITFPPEGLLLYPPPGGSSRWDDYLLYKASQMKFLGHYPGLNKDQLINWLAKSLAAGKCPSFDQYYFRDTWQSAKSFFANTNHLQLLNEKIAFYSAEQRRHNQPPILEVAQSDEYPAEYKVSGQADYLLVNTFGNQDSKIKYITLSPKSNVISCYK